MIIKQGEMDDAVLLLRVHALLHYIGGMMQDRTVKELPEQLQEIKEFVAKHTKDKLFEDVTAGDEARYHVFHLVEELSRDHPDAFRSIYEVVDDKKTSKEWTGTAVTAVSKTIMAELLMNHSSDPSLLD